MVSMATVHTAHLGLARVPLYSYAADIALTCIALQQGVVQVRLSGNELACLDVREKTFDACKQAEEKRVREERTLRMFIRCVLP